LFPRWCTDLYGGYGSPLFNFYAPGLFTVATPFHLLGASPALALKITVLLFTALGLAGTYQLAYALTRRRDAAVLALVISAQTPYHFIQLLTRGDLAEYCAYCLVPSAMQAYLRLRSSSPRVGPGLAAAGWHAAILLTHTITGFWFTMFAAAVVAGWAAEDVRNRRVISAVRLVTVLGAGAGLTAIYTLPAMLERDLVRISIMTEGGFAIEKNFITELKWMLSPGFFFAGYPFAISFIGCLVAIAGAPARRQQLLRWAGASLVVTLLMLPVSGFIWAHIPLVRFTQFPWRLLGFLGTLTALSWAILWNVAVPARSRWSDAVIVIVLALAAQRTLAEMPSPAPLEEARVPTTPAMVASEIQSTTVSDEYLPLTAPTPPRRHRAGYIHDTGQFVQVDDIRRAGIGFHMMASAEQPGAYVDLAQHWFPRWVARRVAGPAKVEVDNAPPSGMIRVTFPKAGHYDVYIAFAMSPARIVGLVMTLFALAFLPLILLQLRRRGSEAHAA
jgi:hypothetical protein